MGKNIFFEEICHGVFCDAAESFEGEACGTFVVLNCVSLSICALLFLLAAWMLKICTKNSSAGLQELLSTLPINSNQLRLKLLMPKEHDLRESINKDSC